MSTFYEEVGGSAVFADLVSAFYARVSVDPILRPMYPPGELRTAAEHLQKFLEQYFGGPTTYSDERGHPRLRVRHAGFHINPAARDSWLSCMQEAVNGLSIEQDKKNQLWKYFEMAAESLVNQLD
jgi:hemoglobin